MIKTQRSVPAFHILVTLLLSSVFMLSSCSGHPTSVARVVDGQLEHGRFVSPVSYAAYARAAELEAAAQLEAAEAAYQDALRYDPTSPQIWTRLGSVRCHAHLEEAGVAFDMAERLEADYAPLWYERASCFLAQGHPERALPAAARSLELDPNQLATSKLIADVYLSLGQPDEAARYLNALVARYPQLRTTRHWREASPRADPSSAPNALTGSGKTKGDVSHESTELGALDLALLNDDMSTARQLALELGIGLSELAVRAVLLGRTQSALDQARQLRTADPTDATAWVTELAAADLLGNELAFQTALEAAVEDPTLPSALATIVFFDLLERRAGLEAARAWFTLTQATRSSDREDDLLLAEHARRVEQALEASKPAGTRASSD